MSSADAPSIREYRDGDAASVRACLIELQDYERRIDPRLRPGESMADDYLAQIRERCRTWAGTILVAECGGVTAGIAVIYARVPFEELDDPPGEFAVVSDLVVLELFRRRGVGAALMREAERYARVAGATELRIGVLSENREARALYLHAGFAPYVETLAKRLDPPST